MAVTELKEFEIELRLRNNLLKARRVAQGLSQEMLSALIGVHKDDYGKLEVLSASPLTKKGEWRRVALTIAAYYDVPPEVLWPGTVQQVKTPRVFREVSKEELWPALSDYQTLALESPEVLTARQELSESVEHVLQSLPHREASAVRMRFGLGSEDPITLKKIGAASRVQKAARRTVNRALRKLRHPVRAKQLRSFLED